MPTEHAKPGDTIRITILNNFFNKECLIIECPNEYKDRQCYSDMVWVKIGGMAHAICRDNYEIIQSQIRCRSTVENHLDKQLDDNLRGVFS